MRIEQSFMLGVPVERAWRYVRDAQFVAACIPGCERVEALDGNNYLSTVAVAIGPFHMRFALEIQILSERQNVELRFRARGEEGGRASTLNSESVLRLEPAEEACTQVRLESEVQVNGRLGRFGLGVMRKKTQDLAKQFAELMSQRISAELQT